MSALGSITNAIRRVGKATPADMATGAVGFDVEAWQKAAGKPDGYDATVALHLAYLHNHVESDTRRMLKQHFPDSWNRIAPVSLNYYSTIIARQAKVFGGDGERFDLLRDGEALVGDEAARWTQVVERSRLLPKLKRAERQALSARKVFLRFTMDRLRNRVRVTLFAANRVWPVLPTDSADIADAVGVLLEVEPAGGKRRFEFWSGGPEGRNFIVDEDGNREPNDREDRNTIVDDNRVPIIPIVALTAADVDTEGVWPLPGDQLISAARNINVGLSNHFHLWMTSSHGQWVTEATDAGQAQSWTGESKGTGEAGHVKVAFGPDEIINVPIGRTLRNISVGANLDGSSRALTELAKLAAVYESISPGEVSTEPRQVSGFALQLEQRPLSELRDDLVSAFDEATERAIDLVRLVHNNMVDGNAGRFIGVTPRWTPGALSVPADPEQQLRIWRGEIDLNLTTSAEVLAEKRGISLEKAEALVAENAKANSDRGSGALARLIEGGSTRPGQDNDEDDIDREGEPEATEASAGETSDGDAATDDRAATGDAPDTETGDAQRLALNGAQVTSMQGVLIAAQTGELPVETVKHMLMYAFLVPEADAEAMLRPIRDRGERPPGGVAATDAARAVAAAE